MFLLHVQADAVFIHSSSSKDDLRPFYSVQDVVWRFVSQRHLAAVFFKMGPALWMSTTWFWQERRVTFSLFLKKKMVSTPPSGGWVNYRSQKLRRPSITNFVPHSTGDKFFYSAQTYRFLLQMIRCESFQLCVRQQETTSSSFIQTKFLLTNLVFIAISFRQTICAEIDIFTGRHHPWRSGQGIVFLAVPLAAGRRKEKKEFRLNLARPCLDWL